MSKRFKSVLISAILVLGLIVTRFIYIEVNKNIYENRVTNYLIEEKGYDENEIA